MFALTSAVARRWAKAELWERAERHRSLFLMSYSLNAWVGASLALARDPETRARAERASGQRAGRLLGASMAAWKQRSGAWAEKRLKEQEATLHCRSSLGARALRGWAAVTAAEREGREAKRRRLQGLRGRLGLLKAGRMLGAWQERQVQAAMKRFQVSIWDL